MENIFFTQLSIPEIRQLFRQELETYFETQKQSSNSLPEADTLLNIQQAAELLNLSVATCYTKVHKAELPVCKRSHRLYFSKQDLLEYVKAGRKKTVTEIAAEAKEFVTRKKK